jgi:Methionyl-tRNA formyltransferase
VFNFIRGLAPYPTAWTELRGQMLKVFRAGKEIINPSVAPGTVVLDGKKSLKIATLDGFIVLLEVQLSGRRRMSITDFLNGFKLNS